MIILFSTAEDPAPSLPDLFIRDAESGTNIPVAGLDGWDDDYIQAQAITFAPMTFATELTGVVATGQTGGYWCRRLTKVLLRVNFSTSGANAVIRPLYYDANGVECIGDSVTVTAIARQDGSAYMSPVEFFDTYGANQMRFVVDSISAGTIDVSLAGV